MKKPFYIIAAALAAVCVVGAAGCKSNTVSRAVLSSNWYSGTGFGGFQPTIIKGNENFEEDGRTGAEKITYAVTHTPLEEKYRNKYYSVAYGENSTYTTEFYAENSTRRHTAIPRNTRPLMQRRAKLSLTATKPRLTYPL